MGEYAKRKSDGTDIKIGTCEDMFYIRFEDRDKVTALPNSIDLGSAKQVDGLRFRIPFPDEDHLRPGEYDEFNRGLRLYRQCGVGRSSYTEDWKDESTLEDIGTMQLHHQPSGLLLNVPCYHGLKLPDVVEPMRAFWNGKGHAFELSSIKAVLVDGGWLKTVPVVRCRFCGHMWRYEWENVWEFIAPEMRMWLRQYNPAAAA